VSNLPVGESHRLSRRRILQLTGGGAALLAGRAPAIAQEATPAAGENPFGVAQNQGGTYTIAYFAKGSPRVFVPTSYFGTTAFFVCKLLYTPLLFLDRAWQNLGPAIATSWEWAPDGKQVTLQLRDDVTFHDGQPLTARDVEFTYKLMVRADGFPAVQDIGLLEGGEEYKAGTSETLPGVTAVDDHTVRFSLTSPSSVFELYLSNCGILPAHAFSEDALAVGGVIEQLPFFNFENGPPIGTGPWKVKDYNPETNLTFEANEAYFKGAPILDGIILRFGVTGPAKIAGVESGEFDANFIQAVFQEAVTHRDDPNLNLITDYSMANEWTVTVATEKPELNVQVRQGLLTAIDTQTLYDTITFGYARPAPSLMMHPSLFPNPALPTYSYDVDRAKQLLQEGNWDSNKTLKFGSFATALAGTPETMAAIANMWKEVGVNTEIVPLDAANFEQIVFTDVHDYDLVFDSFAWLAYDPSSAFQDLACERRPTGTNYCNPDFDAAMLAAIHTADAEEATALYQQAQTILETELPYLPVWIEPEIWAINKRMHGGVLGRGPLNDIQSELWWKE
jgi:ABC-type transport system substrate-binding protein